MAEECPPRNRSRDNGSVLADPTPISHSTFKVGSARAGGKSGLLSHACVRDAQYARHVILFRARARDAKKCVRPEDEQGNYAKSARKEGE